MGNGQNAGQYLRERFEHCERLSIDFFAQVRSKTGHYISGRVKSVETDCNVISVNGWYVDLCEIEAWTEYRE